MELLMGIDLGSTSLKAVVYDREGNMLACGSRPTLKNNPNPDRPEWTVWQPEQIWGGATEAIREAMARLDDPRAVKGVAVTGMGMDGVPMDPSGRWLYPFISWHDPRTNPQYQWWLENVGGEKTFLTGGWPIWSISTALRLLWMAEHEPEILACTDKWLLIEDFLNFMLCGRQATDYTMASCTGMFDQARLDWSDEILSQVGIDRRLLSDPLPSGTILGEVHQAAAEATGLSEGTPVVLGGHDFLCGALPVGAFQPGLVLDVTGTWEIVLTSTHKPMLTQEVFQAGLTMENHVARDTYAGWGGAVAAEMLEWQRREYGWQARRQAETQGGTDWDYLMASAAEAAPGCRGVMFLPHMSGAGCPVVDPRSAGSFVGLTNSTTQQEMLRAVIEGLDYQFLDIVKTMESSMHLRAEKFVAVGGAVKNKFWMQNKADVVGRPVEVPQVEE
ncbi:MAG TPA: FGGY family carbohydrate kinase, partial [Anaerolineales bacterium]|nr:FGGY family carbohydrate kinase [Anaerolineales bacterium]